MAIRLSAYTRVALAYKRNPHTGWPRNPAAMALRMWFAANPEASPKEMAMLCGVHQMTILYLRNGRRRAGPLLARKIEALTKGAVPRTLWQGVRIRPPLKNDRQPELGFAEPIAVYGELPTDEPQAPAEAPRRPVQGEMFGEVAE
jgi:hypothetical protein